MTEKDIMSIEDFEFAISWWITYDKEADDKADCIRAYRALAAERDRLAEQQRWIPCSEKLPTGKDDEGIPCLVRVSGEHPLLSTMVLSWNCYHRVWDDLDMDDISPYHEKVTHWMPLPAPPTQTTEGEQ
ncbi:MAG: DUF551 domain-containing protein [Patescibacteria group bacterium]|nr:DUF551 domain-containing protein [Patescibacteria group bacterium]